MSFPEILMLLSMLVSFVAYAGAISICRQASAEHVEMIRRHARWREESRRQFDSDMAAIERLLDKAKQVQK